MAYDQSIIDAILSRARQVKDPRARDRYTRAALQTGIVESGLRNLNHGDADSEGWRQERRSLYPDPTNVSASVDRFFNEAAQLDRGQPSWQLATDVQRPAAQYRGRYKDVAKQAAALLGGSTMQDAGSSSPAAAASSSAPPTIGDPGVAGDFGGLLQSLLGQGQQPAAPPPSSLGPIASGPQLPQGFRPLTPTQQSGPEQNGGVEGALGLLETLRGTDPALGSGDGSQPGAEPVAQQVMRERQAGSKVMAGISPRARPGDPVVSRKQSVGGEHETAGLAGYPAKDFFAPAGTHAVAPVSGRVVKLSGHDPAEGPTNGPHGPLGYSVYIQGEDGRTYFLTHLGSRNVKVGQRLKQGQIIGTVADYDKYGTPSHIHQGVHG